MPPGLEYIARKQIDRMLEQADWAVQDAKAVNLYELMTPMMKESIDRNNVPKVTQNAKILIVTIEDMTLLTS